MVFSVELTHIFNYRWNVTFVSNKMALFLVIVYRIIKYGACSINQHHSIVVSIFDV